MARAASPGDDRGSTEEKEMRQIVIALLMAANLALALAACGHNEMRQNNTEDPNGTLYPGYGNE